LTRLPHPRRVRRSGLLGSRRGLTLIEITIALGLAALLMSVATVSIRALSDANLRSAATELTGAIKYSYDRAIMQNRIQRIAFDLDRGQWWIDYTEDPFSIRERRTEGTMGAVQDEDGAIVQPGEEDFRDDLRLDDDVDQEVKKALEGGLGASFSRDEGERVHPLPGGVRFARVWTGHQEEPFEKGIAFLHFFDGGWTEPALIELRDDGDDVVTLKVAPLTGRVRSYHEALDAPEVEDYDPFEEGDR
jgi:general secretion pathway protein H